MADPPVVARLRIVMTQLGEAAQRGPETKYSRYVWVMQSMMDEILDELADGTDSDKISTWFEQFGKVVEWCGSGDDSVLPESIRPYLTQRMLAITAGTSD